VSDGNVSFRGDVSFRLHEETQEEKEARLERAEQLRIEREERELQRQQAEVTAQELLEQLLTPEEFRLYQEHGKVLVRGNDADYLLSKSTGHIRRIKKDEIEDLCLHIQDKGEYVPSDNVISMKLYIEAKEKEFNEQARNWGRKQLSDQEHKFLQAVGS